MRNLITFLLLIFLNISALANSKDLLLATTTSLEDTGFLDYLAPQLQNDTKINLRWVAVGSGAALEMGKNCDVDAVLTHDPKAEEDFMHKGYGVSINKIMYNDFVIVGPANDPAKIKNKSVTEALQSIASQQSTFISRDDKSGTYEKELELWSKAQINLPQKSNWYLQSGQGMLATLNIAATKHAYTLTDRGTFIKYLANNDSQKLIILVQKKSNLINKYNLILINPKYCKNVNIANAEQFKDWLIGEQAKKLIVNFKLKNQPIFFTQ